MILATLALLAAAQAPAVQTIAEDIRARPASLWEDSCGLIDDRDTDVPRDTPPARRCIDRALMKRASVESDPNVERAFEEAIDLTRPFGPR